MQAEGGEDGNLQPDPLQFPRVRGGKRGSSVAAAMDISCTAR